MSDILIITWSTWIGMMLILKMGGRSSFSITFFPVVISISAYVINMFSEKLALLAVVAIHMPIIFYLIYIFLKSIIIEIKSK